MDKTIRICKQCGKKIIEGNKQKIYCNESCKVKYYKTHDKNGNIKKVIKKNCVVCGTGFVARRADIVCCSNKCKDIRGKELASVRWKKPSYTRECKACGIEFITKVKDKEYCCSSCEKGEGKRVDGVIEIKRSDLKNYEKVEKVKDMNCYRWLGIGKDLIIHSKESARLNNHSLQVYANKGWLELLKKGAEC